MKRFHVRNSSKQVPFPYFPTFILTPCFANSLCWFSVIQLRKCPAPLAPDTHRNHLRHSQVLLIGCGSQCNRGKYLILTIFRPTIIACFLLVDIINCLFLSMRQVMKFLYLTLLGTFSLFTMRLTQQICLCRAVT